LSQARKLRESGFVHDAAEEAAAFPLRLARPVRRSLHVLGIAQRATGRSCARF